jgi:glutathione S-transferase
MAINLYLAKKHGKLYPADAKHEALVWQWSSGRSIAPIGG